MSEQTIHFIITLLQSTAALLIVLDPLGLLPIVVALTRQLSPAGRQSVVTQAVLTAFVLLMFFTLAGTGILSLFRVTINDLQIAGGILLLVMALSLVLSGRMSSEATPTSSASFVPLASPLLVGPGAITAAVVLVATNGLLIASLAVVIAFFVTWLVLRSITTIYRLVGESGSDVIARIMGILLAAIAVQYIREGILGIFAQGH